jgi:4-amino-4-deoxy-L-arabinose transferase-like glycosyltransferase
MKPSDLIRYAAALVLLSIPIFYNLGELPIKIWDESRLAMNALEMYANHQFLVVHFDGQPEMWSTKPPLMIWLQVFSIRIFGFSEFAIRFPSALAALFTCLTLVVVAHRYLKNYWLGLAAALILLTTHHYMGHHVIRTGDYDSLLILFLTLMSFSVFLFAERDQPKYLLAAFLFFGMAVATKGVASILIVPGLLLYLILRRKFLPVFRLRVFWYGVGWVLLILLILYGGRELLNPGYLRAVFENEIGGRYFEVNEGHVGGPLYYFGVLHQDYWPWFLPVVLFTLFSAKKDKMYRVSFFSGIVALCFLFFVSAAKTKL